MLTFARLSSWAKKVTAKLPSPAPVISNNFLFRCRFHDFIIDFPDYSSHPDILCPWLVHGFVDADVCNCYIHNLRILFDFYYFVCVYCDFLLICRDDEMTNLTLCMNAYFGPCALHGVYSAQLNP